MFLLTLQNRDSGLAGLGYGIIYFVYFPAISAVLFFIFAMNNKVWTGMGLFLSGLSFFILIAVSIIFDVIRDFLRGIF